MVSYPSDDAYLQSQAPSARRNGSVASSGASTIRRYHQRGRSHAGTTSSTRAPANEFPIFTQTGDVEIIIHSDPRLRRRRDSGRGGSDERRPKRYLLHRLILSQCSGFFETSISSQQPSYHNDRQHQTSMNGVATRYRPREEQERIRWRYELDWSQAHEEAPRLVPRDASKSVQYDDYDQRAACPPPIRPKPQPPPSGFFRSMANLSALNLSSRSHRSSRDASSGAVADPLHPSELLVQAYDNLFRIFYNHPPVLDGVEIPRAYVECKALLQLADMYEALEVVGPRVDHHLLRFGPGLWKQIARYPPSYLRIGYLAKSKAIFSEAIIHVVGNWPSCAAQLGYIGPLAPRGPAAAAAQSTQLPEVVFEIIEDKVDELEDIKAKVEAKLWRLTLTTSRGERVTPANSWLDWLAMSLFRQWLAEQTTPPPVSILKDSYPNTAIRGGSRGSTIASSVSHRSSSASRNRDMQIPPSSFHPAGSVVSASAAAYPRSSFDDHHNRPAHASTSSSRGVPPFNTGRAFRLIGQGGQAYLPHHELKAFLKLHPESYDRDRLRRFERRVDEVKNLARDAVKPLMRNFLSVDVLSGGGGGGGREGSRDGEGGAQRDGVAVGYLTCTRVEEGDYPWQE